jgi:hypothetical protein
MVDFLPFSVVLQVVAVELSYVGACMSLPFELLPKMHEGRGPVPGSAAFVSRKS